MIDALFQNFTRPFAHQQQNVSIIQPDMLCTVGISIILCTILFTGSHVFAEDSSTKVTQSSLVVPYAGDIPKGPLKFPLYKGEDFFYFSAGVGLEERQLTYPPYPLKLVLVAGARAFLSNVSITVRQLDGPLTFDIPADHVEGPWVFMKLPAGTYLITASNKHQKTIEKQVSIVDNQTTTIHLRWPDS